MCLPSWTGSAAGRPGSLVPRTLPSTQHAREEYVSTNRMNGTLTPRVLGSGLPSSVGACVGGLCSVTRVPEIHLNVCLTPLGCLLYCDGHQNTMTVQARGRAWNLPGSRDSLLERTRGKRWQRGRITGPEVLRSLLSPSFPWVFSDPCDPRTCPCCDPTKFPYLESDHGDGPSAVPLP